MPGGRPRIEIDAGDFKKLCGMQCTLEEMAGFFSCSEDTVENWCKRELQLSFTEAYKKYSAGGKISLRRYQFKLAEHSPAMAIWLGKQYLGQSDNTMATDEDTEKLLKGVREALGEIESAID